MPYSYSLGKNMAIEKHVNTLHVLTKHVQNYAVQKLGPTMRTFLDNYYIQEISLWLNKYYIETPILIGILYL